MNYYLSLILIFVGPLMSVFGVFLILRKQKRPLGIKIATVGVILTLVGIIPMLDFISRSQKKAQFQSENK